MNADGGGADGNGGDLLWSCVRCLFFNHSTFNVCQRCHVNRPNLVGPAPANSPPWLALPATWIQPSPGAKKCIKTLLHPKHAEYKEVLEFISRTTFNTVRDIVNIYRLENPTLYRMYQLRRAQLDEDNGPDVQNERILFHGTSKEAVNVICNRGFNRSYAGKNATRLGHGVYFARDFGYAAGSMFSPDDRRGLKYVFQCRVLTGRFTVGNQSLLEPPFRDKANYKLFNSVVDSSKKPGIFAIFNDACAYAEYLVVFKGYFGS